MVDIGGPGIKLLLFNPSLTGDLGSVDHGVKIFSAWCQLTPLEAVSKRMNGSAWAQDSSMLRQIS